VDSPDSQTRICRVGEKVPERARVGPVERRGKTLGARALRRTQACQVVSLFQPARAAQATGSSSKQASTHPVPTREQVTSGMRGKVILKHARVKQATTRVSRCCITSSMVHCRQVRTLSTNAGDKRAPEKQVLLVAQGAGVALHAEAEGEEAPPGEPYPDPVGPWACQSGGARRGRAGKLLPTRSQLPSCV